MNYWQVMDPDEFKEWCLDLGAQPYLQLAKGQKKYGEAFAGDPAKHILEELADVSNYLFFLIQQREELERLLLAGVDMDRSGTISEWKVMVHEYFQRKWESINRMNGEPE